MLGKLVVLALLMVPAGILLGLTDLVLLDVLAMMLFLGGSAILGLALLLALVLFVEGIFFGGTDRWHRFN